MRACSAASVPRPDVRPRARPRRARPVLTQLGTHESVPTQCRVGYRLPTVRRHELAGSAAGARPADLAHQRLGGIHRAHRRAVWEHGVGGLGVGGALRRRRRIRDRRAWGGVDRRSVRTAAFDDLGPTSAPAVVAGTMALAIDSAARARVAVRVARGGGEPVRSRFGRGDSEPGARARAATGERARCQYHVPLLPPRPAARRASARGRRFRGAAAGRRRSELRRLGLCSWRRSGGRSARDAAPSRTPACGQASA